MLAETRDRAGVLQIFSLTLSQLSHRGLASVAVATTLRALVDCGFCQCACQLALHDSRHCVRVAKEMVSKSVGLCPQGLKSLRCRHGQLPRGIQLMSS